MQKASGLGLHGVAHLDVCPTKQFPEQCALANFMSVLLCTQGMSNILKPQTQIKKSMQVLHGQMKEYQRDVGIVVFVILCNTLTSYIKHRNTHGTNGIK